MTLFVSDLTLNGIELETLDEMKLLGSTVRSDLSWNQMIMRAYKKLWILMRLKSQGASSFFFCFNLFFIL